MTNQMQTVLATPVVPGVRQGAAAARWRQGFRSRLYALGGLAAATAVAVSLAAAPVPALHVPAYIVGGTGTHLTTVEQKTLREAGAVTVTSISSLPSNLSHGVIVFNGCPQGAGVGVDVMSRLFMSRNAIVGFGCSLGALAAAVGGNAAIVHWAAQADQRFAATGLALGPFIQAHIRALRSMEAHPEAASPPTVYHYVSADTFENTDGTEARSLGFGGGQSVAQLIQAANGTWLWSLPAQLRPSPVRPVALPSPS